MSWDANSPCPGSGERASKKLPMKVGGLKAGHERMDWVHPPGTTGDYCRPYELRTKEQLLRVGIDLKNRVHGKDHTGSSRHYC